MIKNDVAWMAENRERILAEWSKRYESKAAPKNRGDDVQLARDLAQCRRRASAQSRFARHRPRAGRRPRRSAGSSQRGNLVAQGRHSEWETTVTPPNTLH
jgi:hypothetical protein